MRLGGSRLAKQCVALPVLISFFCTSFVFFKLVFLFNSICKSERLELSLPSDVIAALRNYSFQANKAFENEHAEEVSFQELMFPKNFNLTNLTKTNYFTCEDFHQLPDTYQAVKETLAGNRGISFVKISIEGRVIDVVYKEATRYFETIGDDYKYNNAKKEIEFLTKLKGLPGIPRLYGSCVEENYVGYFVERINGHTVCNDNGTTIKCAKATFLLDSVAKSENPKDAALKLAYTTSRLFQLLEERHLFLEDLSGVNLMFTSDFEVFLADADSLIFYNKNRLFSNLPCASDRNCYGPSGNLWLDISLNLKIYSKCNDLNGMCVNSRCRGFDNSLHACGMAEWYLCKLSKFFEDDVIIYKQLESICSCLGTVHPDNRCSFSFALKQYAQLMS